MLVSSSFNFRRSFCNYILFSLGIYTLVYNTCSSIPGCSRETQPQEPSSLPRKKNNPEQQQHQQQNNSTQTQKIHFFQSSSGGGVAAPLCRSGTSSARQCLVADPVHPLQHSCAWSYPVPAESILQIQGHQIPFKNTFFFLFRVFFQLRQLLLVINKNCRLWKTFHSLF